LSRIISDSATVFKGKCPYPVNGYKKELLSANLTEEDELFILN